MQNEDRVPGFESWWDVPIAEVSGDPEVRAARADYEAQRERERIHFVTSDPGGN